MNARWQQIVIFAGLVLALAWLCWQWPHSPMLALAGAAGLLLLPALSVTLQFICMLAAPSRAEALLRPAALLRAFGAEVVLAYRIFGWRQPFRENALADDLPANAGKPAACPGVVLVHGFLCNRAFWQPWQRMFAGRAIACSAVTLEPILGSIDDCVPGLDAAVRRMAAATGRPPVLIGHSMGGLVIRAWLRSRGVMLDEGVSEEAAAQRLQALVARIITLGTPHRGTWIASTSYSINGRQMRLDSDWLHCLARHEPQALATRLTCWYSNSDNLVFPSVAARYPGADNRLASDLAHVQMAFSPEVMQGCVELVEQADIDSAL